MKNETRRSAAPAFLLMAGLLLILSAVGSFFLLRDQSVANAPVEVTPAGTVQAVSRVSVEEARQAYESGDAVIVDVRDREYYDQEHISGALSIPLADIQDRMTELDPSKWIITY